MTGLERLLAPRSVAVVGVSADPSKHGTRVTRNLTRLGFTGHLWGVNPTGADIDDVEVFPSLGDLPGQADVVVCAVPAPAVSSVVRDAGAAGSGTVIVFAGGFAETGEAGTALQSDLTAAAAETGVRVLGPNSGGVIVPSNGVAMSFLTCLDRPANEVRSGPVGLVTQSGGTGSYLHNLAAAEGGGLAASISTGNECDADVADGVDLLVRHDEVQAIAVVLETVRNGASFCAAVRRAHAAGKPVVATVIGRSDRGRRLMRTHTGALAHPRRVLGGVLASLGVAVAETPQEMLAMAEILARTPRPAGPRVGIVTHSGGIAIMLSDLAESAGVELPAPSAHLRTALGPLLDHGAADNPLDMGGIIGGAHRYGDVVGAFATSGDFDAVLAVSTAHPRAHSEERVAALLALDSPIPIVQLWMAGDVGAGGLAALRAAGAPVTDEPRAAVRALAALTKPPPEQESSQPDADPLPAGAFTEHAAKRIIETWGLPIVPGDVAVTVTEAVDVADRLGYPVVLKISAPDIPHKSEIGGVIVGLETAATVEAAAGTMLDAAAADGAKPSEVLVERHAPGLEVILGGIRDDSFGPLVLVGIGGLVAEAMDDVQIRLAPVAADGALRMINDLAGVRGFTEPRLAYPADLEALADIVATFSRQLAAHSDIASIDLNPVSWTGSEWLVLDAFIERAP